MGKTRSTSQNLKHKRYLNKIKGDPEKAKKYREKATQRMRKRRAELAKLNKNNKILIEMKIKEQARSKRYRQKKKDAALSQQQQQELQQQENKLEAYTCKQTLGKAIKRAESALPRDSQKKIEVIAALYKKYVEPTNQANENTFNDNLEMEAKLKLAKEIYQREDISVQAAGRKDTIIVGGEIVPKRFMLLTVSEAYEIYKQETVGRGVSKSKFFECRPQNVQLSSKIPHNMCVCIYHANFSFLLKGCASIIDSFPKSFESFLKSVCCNIEHEVCMTNDCEECTKDVMDIVPLKYWSKMDENVNWQYWRKVDDRVSLTSNVAPLLSLLHELKTQLPLFKTHFFVKRAQQNYFEAVRKSVRPGALLLQVDFAENYRLICQNEIQSAHFNYKQVSIFTCVAWMYGQTKSFAIISDSLNHGKVNVYVYIRKLVEQIKSQHGNFESIYLFSDGSSCQFKNKFIVWNLPTLMTEFGCKRLEWNYFATSHGKGAVDGIGAIVKRKIWQLTKTKNIILNDAVSFYNCAKKCVKGINIIFVGANEIAEISPIINQNWENLPNIPGIRMIHSVFCDCDSKIQIALTASSKYKNIS